MLFHFMLLVLHFLEKFILLRNRLLVETTNGVLKGFNYDLQLSSGLSADVFLGIPYGKAERFEAFKYLKKINK